MGDILDKIRDERLRDLLELYRESPNNFTLVDILNYFRVNFWVDAMDAVMPKFEVDGERVYLGGLISGGQMFGVFLDVQEQTVSLHIETQYYMVLTRENKTGGGDHDKRNNKPD